MLRTKLKFNNLNVTGTQKTGSSEFIFALLVKHFMSSSRRRGKFPFRKRSVPFSRHLEIFLTVNDFFSTKLKKKENLQVTT